MSLIKTVAPIIGCFVSLSSTIPLTVCTFCANVVKTEVRQSKNNKRRMDFILRIFNSRKTKVK
jgi:hypothetical protein